MNNKYSTLLSNLIKNLNKNKIVNNNELLTNNNNKILSNNNFNLSRYNNKFDYNNIIYSYNNNNLLNNIKYKYIIKKYINYMLNHKLSSWINIDSKISNNKTVLGNILYKDPIIFINKNTYNVILFIYKPLINNKSNKIINNNNLLISRLINNLINKSDILLNRYNITLNIKPIILTYDYLDSNIYSKSLSKYLSRYPELDKIYNININKYLIDNFLIKKLNNINIINKIFDIKLLLNKSNTNNKVLMNSLFNKDMIIHNNLLFQYIIGNNWKYRGKNYNSESNARALKHYVNNGFFKLLSTKLNSNFKLNYYSSNWSQSQSFIINKNGKYNVKVKLSHF